MTALDRSGAEHLSSAFEPCLIKRKVIPGNKYRREAAMPKRSTSQNVPKEMQARFDEITHITDAYSDEHLNNEYKEICRQLTATLCRKRLSPLLQGKANTWACAIIH